MGLEPATKRFLDGLLNTCAIGAAHWNRPIRSSFKLQEGSFIVNLDTPTYHSIRVQIMVMEKSKPHYIETSNLPVVGISIVL